MVYKKFACLWVCIICFVILPYVSHAESEQIDSFVTDIQVLKDSSFSVTEKITYVFPEEKHGIFRCIPTLHAEQPVSLLRERYIDIEVETVTMDDGVVPYTVLSGNTFCKNSSDLMIKIGDPGSVISGVHTYTISYVVFGAISYEPNGGAELYWNVTGNDWSVPIITSEVRVSSPDSILTRQRACYKGFRGESASCEIKVEGDDSIPVFSARNLRPGEGLTIAQALNRSVIAHDVRERYKTFLVIGICALIFIFGTSYSVYRYKTKFKTGNTIIPQYEPYPGVKPMYAGYLFDKRLDPRDITAGIVYLAEQGFIKIKKTEKKVLFVFEVDEYTLSYTGKPYNELDAFNLKILELIFGELPQSPTEVSLTDLRDRAVENFAKTQELNKALLEDLKAQDYFTNIFFTRRTRRGYEALDHLVGFKEFLSVTESQRYIFHNAPQINAEHFMEYLPYAIAFGVEKQWAKTFEKIAIPNPDWYDGGAGMHTFNALSLSQSIGAFSTAFAGSSGTSASSGGGSSGGGSGGGGGGSW